MRWRGQQESENVEDRRGMRPGGLVVGGGLGTLVIAGIVLLLGGDPRQVLRLLSQSETTTRAPVETGAPAGAPEDSSRQFVGVVLKDTEDVWGDLFQRMGKSYQPPHLVLFRDAVESGCGMAGSASGPFYCPEDQRVYIDLAFYDELRERFGAPGDFAQAYVIAHEVGHHVQNQLGITDQVDAMRQRVSPAEANALSVRLELQADFLAGVWAHHAQRMKNILEPGDIEEALNAATAIGDDRLQREATGHVTPDSFTHGTSAQRVRWFKKGYETGDIRQGDTFAATAL